MSYTNKTKQVIQLSCSLPLQARKTCKNEISLIDFVLSITPKFHKFRTVTETGQCEIELAFLILSGTYIFWFEVSVAIAECVDNL